MIKDKIAEYLVNNGFKTFAPKAVLFDMDGVLFNSMPNHAVAWQRAMEKFGIAMTEEDAYLTEGQRGIDTIRVMVRQQQGRDIDEDEAQRMYDEKTRLYHEMPQAKVFPGVKYLMGEIKKRGMEIVIVTGSGQLPLIERLVEEFQGFVSKEKIITAYDVSRGKPAPDPYLKGLEVAGHLQPWEGIVVENAPLGVRAGVAAKIFTVGINSGKLPQEALESEGANVVYDRITELCDAWDQMKEFPVSSGDKWEMKYCEIMHYMHTTKCRPSKHHAEDHAMHYWIKYNKRVKAAGKMREDRLAKFDELLRVAASYRRVNQHAYLNVEKEEDLWK